VREKKAAKKIPNVILGIVLKRIERSENSKKHGQAFVACPCLVHAHPVKE